MVKVLLKKRMIIAGKQVWKTKKKKYKLLIIFFLIIFFFLHFLSLHFLTLVIIIHNVEILLFWSFCYTSSTHHSNLCLKIYKSNHSVTTTRPKLVGAITSTNSSNQTRPLISLLTIELAIFIVLNFFNNFNNFKYLIRNLWPRANFICHMRLDRWC